MKKIYLLCILLFGIQLTSNALNLLGEPVITTPLTEAYPLEMPTLKAYPIYVNAFIEEPIIIDLVEITINGDVFSAIEDEGFYYYLWTPSSYGIHEISIRAAASNGTETIESRTMTVTNSASSLTVNTLQDVVIEFGGENSRWFYGTYTMPQFVNAYDSINAYFDVECPAISGGCDDWDRWAHVDVKGPDGNWIQIIRYITPYGVGCNHELDVTDYMSLLQGEIEFRVFIDTWGTGGWQLSLNLEYNQGTPEYPYSGVIETWDGSYSFGDPSNLQPVETFNAEILEGVNTSYLRLSNTGHGWGANNSGNAAEFFNAYHFIDVDGEQTFIQHLWNTCNPNPDGCTGQQGSWNYNRAGWCPGAISPPDIYDLNPYIGTSIDLDYRFHPTYDDECHPNNPDCVSGDTCADCNDGYNPVYFVDGQIINHSNLPVIYGNILNVVTNNDKIYDLTVYPNPSNGMFNINTIGLEGITRVTVNTIDGSLVKAYYFNSNEELNNYQFNMSTLSSGMYFINLENASGTGTKKIILE
ncbi:MAG: hypothetical protein ACI9SJ_001558 [Flavobacteriaceae bacterium]|jgi:hypothetical protein|uniref:T9SS type A sorting domain-containing protein n=1 Tax=Candidatus Marifrigoribacter sp. Uisw_064 TaxID=3230970 RepID=UPI003ADE3E18